MRRRWPLDTVRLEALTCVNWCAICWARISKGCNETVRPLAKEAKHTLSIALLPKIQWLRISRQRLVMEILGKLRTFRSPLALPCRLPALFQLLSLTLAEPV